MVEQQVKAYKRRLIALMKWDGDVRRAEEDKLRETALHTNTCWRKFHDIISHTLYTLEVLSEYIMLESPGLACEDTCRRTSSPQLR